MVARCRRPGPRCAPATQVQWRDVSDATDGDGVLVTVRTSKTNQEGDAADVRYLKNGAAKAIRTLRAAAADAAPTDRVIGLSPLQIQRRFTAAARAAGIEARVTAHSGRVGLASDLTARGASTTEVMLAGNWRTSRIVEKIGHEAWCLVEREAWCLVVQNSIKSQVFVENPGPAVARRGTVIGDGAERPQEPRLSASDGQQGSRPAGRATRGILEPDTGR